tara:strand:- start:200 stop:586 length:387 start_codon:yes stop_codon:yes gene_type:complete
MKIVEDPLKTRGNILIALLLLSSPIAYSAEKDINELWCTSMNGDYEFRTKDGTYIDCLTDEFAVEAEYDYKWKESIGQSLHYAETTNKKAAILFIKRNKSNKDYLGELNRVISKFDLPIKVFITEESS